VYHIHCQRTEIDAKSRCVGRRDEVRQIVLLWLGLRTGRTTHILDIPRPSGGFASSVSDTGFVQVRAYAGKEKSKRWIPSFYVECNLASFSSFEWILHLGLYKSFLDSVAFIAGVSKLFVNKIASWWWDSVSLDRRPSRFRRHAFGAGPPLIGRFSEGNGLNGAAASDSKQDYPNQLSAQYFVFDGIRE